MSMFWLPTENLAGLEAHGVERSEMISLAISCSA
jgi:hypothetical protein